MPDNRFSTDVRLIFIQLVNSYIAQFNNIDFSDIPDSVLMNSQTQKKILRCIIAILFSTDAVARLWARRAL